MLFFLAFFIFTGYITGNRTGLDIMIRIKLSLLFAAGTALLALPVMLFFLFWLRWYAGIPACMIFAAGIFTALRSFRKEQQEEPFLEMDLRLLGMIFLFLMLWAAGSGVGGFVSQKTDHYWRNAIFHDMITHEWPVMYFQGRNALVYYISHWLVPAGCGKLVLSFAGPEAAWKTANAVLLFWTTLYLTVSFLLCIHVLGLRHRYKILAALAVFIFFSGADIFGIFFTQHPQPESLREHLEWWSAPFQYSSMTTQLGWVLNQAVPAWLVISLYLADRRISRFAFLLLLLIPFAPFPAVGLAFFMTADAVQQFWEKRMFKPFLREIFSLPNLTVCCSILPVFYLYYSSNTAAGGLSGAIAPEGGVSAEIAFFHYLAFLRNRLPVFWILEFGLLGACLIRRYRKEVLFLTALALLLIIPVEVRRSLDMVMRISIPALFLLMFFTMHFLFTEEHAGRNKAVFYAAAALLLAGALTPLTEFRATWNKRGVVYDMGSLENMKSDGEKYNFMTLRPESAPFFRFLAGK